jgi:hypothetical protein
VRWSGCWLSGRPEASSAAERRLVAGREQAGRRAVALTRWSEDFQGGHGCSPDSGYRSRRPLRYCTPMRTNQWAALGIVACAWACGGSGHPVTTSGSDMAAATSPTGGKDMAAPGVADLSVAASDMAKTTTTATDMAGATTPPNVPADMAMASKPDLAQPIAPPPDLATGTPPAPPTFAADVLPILQNNGCLSHHMTGAWDGVESASGNAAIISYLTTTASSQCGADKLVSGGDAADSYLYQKVSGTFKTPCKQSDPMPEGSGPLPTSQSDVIKQWINAGANND